MPPQRKRKAEEPPEEPGSEEGSEPSLSEEDGSDSSFPTEGSDDPAADAAQDDDEGYEDDEEDVKEITVEFQFFEPQEIDFLGLKTLLAGYLNGEQYDSSGLIDAIITDGNVATVVKTAQDDDPIAMMIALNTQEYKDSAFMREIQTFLSANAPKPAADSSKPLSKCVQEAFASDGTALVLNERLLNTPPSLAPPLVQFLLEEIEDRAAEGDEDSQYFQIQRLVLATRIFLDRNAHPAAQTNGHAANGDTAGPSKPNKRSKQEQEQKPSQPQAGNSLPGPSSVPGTGGAPIVYVRPEDEYFHLHSTWSYVFPHEGRPVTKDGLQPYRLVMQIDMSKVPAAQKELNKVVGNLAEGVSSGAGGSRSAQEELEEEARQAAAAAGAGPGARKGNKSKKGGCFSAKAAQL